MDPKRVVAEGYDRIGADYRPAPDLEHEDVRSWFLAETLVRIAPDTDVLELGCGPGIEAMEFAEGRRYTGVDLSEVMLSLARERVPRGSFLLQDLTTLEFVENSFDAVVSLYVFGHVPAVEHEPTFAKIFRWLRPGGLFCSSFPSGAHEDVVDDFLGVPMFFGGIGREATEEALRKIGFRLAVSEMKEEIEDDGSTVAFQWVIARKPAS